MLIKHETRCHCYIERSTAEINFIRRTLYAKMVTSVL